tara:strand:- start:233 stop:424 length:192 start_codon:yes stop_codon:yes gene_type:complete
MDKIDFMKMFLKMGSMTNQTDKEALAFQERIIFATDGIIKPENWEELSFEERQKRMNKLLKEI